MSNLAVKRITGDMRNYYKSGLNDCGIYCEFSEANIYKVKVLIRGPADTPYAHGNYFFDLTYPTNYPINPPKVLMRTQGLNVRFNPNLYTCGKVCLSILGTWAGPGWTSCCSLTTVLLSIQSLMNERPIQNEPGWENVKDSRSDNYNKVIQYANVAVATIGMLETPVPRFEGFLPVMRTNLIKNRDYFETFLQSSEKDEIYSPVYQLRVRPHYKQLLSRYTAILDQIVAEESIVNARKLKASIAAAAAEKRISSEAAAAASTTASAAVEAASAAAAETVAVEAAETVAVEAVAAETVAAETVVVEAVAVAKKYTRKCPNDKSSTFDVGHEQFSVNDGNIWIVGSSPSGKKRWKKKK
jgi:ubiquitin-conjugating enzyme E2 Z